MLVDIYVELPVRTTIELECFLNHFLSDRKPAQDNIAVFEGDEEPQIFYDEKEALAYLSEHPRFKSAIYWLNENKEEAVESAHAFYTSDGGLIGGISVSLGSEKPWRSKVTSLYPGQPYLTLLETPPPQTLTEFRRSTHLGIPADL